MRHFALFLCLATASIMAAPALNSKIAKAQSVLRDTAKDPDAVQFKDVRYMPDHDLVCGRFNAKNSFGAYVGFQPFAVDSDGLVHNVPPVPSNAEISLMTANNMADIKKRIDAAKDGLDFIQAECAYLNIQ